MDSMIVMDGIFNLLIDGDELIEFGKTANLDIFYDIPSSEIDTIIFVVTDTVGGCLFK